MWQHGFLCPHKQLTALKGQHNKVWRDGDKGKHITRSDGCLFIPCWQNTVLWSSEMWLNPDSTWVSRGLMLLSSGRHHTCHPYQAISNGHIPMRERVDVRDQWILQHIWSIIYLINRQITQHWTWTNQFIFWATGPFLVAHRFTRMGYAFGLLLSLDVPLETQCTLFKRNSPGFPFVYHTPFFSSACHILFGQHAFSGCPQVHPHGLCCLTRTFIESALRNSWSYYLTTTAPVSLFHTTQSFFFQQQQPPSPFFHTTYSFVC